MRRIRSLALVAVVATVPPSSAAGGQASGTFSVTAIVVRSVPVSLRASSEPSVPGGAAASPSVRIAAGRPRGPIVFVDGAPPAFSFGSARRAGR